MSCLDKVSQPRRIVTTVGPNKSANARWNRKNEKTKRAGFPGLCAQGGAGQDRASGTHSARRLPAAPVHGARPHAPPPAAAAAPRRGRAPRPVLGHREPGPRCSATKANSENRGAFVGTRSLSWHWASLRYRGWASVSGPRGEGGCGRWLRDVGRPWAAAGLGPGRGPALRGGQPPRGRPAGRQARREARPGRESGAAAGGHPDCSRQGEPQRVNVSIEDAWFARPCIS